MDMTNAAVIGYMILAAKELKLDKEVIRQLESNMKYFMDMRTEEQAEETYNKFY